MMSKSSALFKEKLAQCLTESLSNKDMDVTVTDLRKFEKKGYSSLVYTFSGEFTSEDTTVKKELILKLYPSVFVEKGRKEFLILKVLKKHNMPVPNAYCFNELCSISGKHFLIMDRIRGEVASNLINDEKTAKTILEKMAINLVKVHSLKLDYIENCKVLMQEYAIRQAPLLETRFIINKAKMKFFFSPRTQRRFVLAVKKLGFIKPKKVQPVLLNLDYILDHIIITDDHQIMIDWGDAIVGDPAYSVARTYHMLRLEPHNLRMDLGEYFVKCYEKYGNENLLVNLQFFKDNAAIEIAKLSGLSYFNAHRIRNYAKIFSLVFGDVVGEFCRAKNLKRQQQHYAQLHNKALRNVIRLQNYSLQYLECDRYLGLNSTVK